MTKVIHLPSPRAGTRVHTAALSPAFPTVKPDGIARQQAIENALCLALYYIRENESPQNIHAATVRAVRAASMLKQACAESANGGRA